MPEHITPQLNAFLDGELDARTRAEAQAHLETCQSCRVELEALRRVSHILRNAPQPDFMPAETFKDRLMLQLPRRDEALPEAAHTNSRLLPWMVPALILACWIFIQVTLNLSGLIALAGRLGVMEGTLAWAAGSPQQTQWFAVAQLAASNLVGVQVPIGLKLLNNAGVFANSVVTPLLWQAGTAALYWGVLAMVWQSKANALRVSPATE